MYEQALYPSVFDKAGIYLYNIISNHIFSDGNKRTGLEAALIFLKLNGYHLNENISDETLTNFILSVASAEHSLLSVQEWLKVNFIKK